MTEFHPNRLGLIASILQSNVDKKSKPEEPVVELCNYTDVYYNDTITADLSFMKATASPDQVERLRLAEGDVIITKDSETADDIGIPAYVESTHDSLVCGYHLTILRARPENVFPKFLYYSMLSRETSEYWEKRANGVTRVSIPQQTVSSLTIPLPDLETQRRIADYLDKEISEMDTLIEDLEALVENLDKRRSPIIRAVFRRYDSVLMPLNLLAKFKTGSTPKDCREDENGLQWVKPDGLAVVSQGTRISEESSDQLPAIPRDSTLFCGIGATVGKVGYLNEPAVTNQQITSLIPVGGVSGKLIYYSLLAEADRIRATAPRSTLPIFNNARLGAEKILMCRPELNEKVLSELDREFERMDALIEESTRLIEYLKARKTTLITEVVTGRKEV